MLAAKRFMDLTWDEFQALPMAAKNRYFNRDDHPYHALTAQQFDRGMLDRLCALATCVRRVAKTRVGMDYLGGLLSHKRAMLYFSQPSSRTFLSFHAACQILGIKVSDVRDAATSSEMKGESQEDSVRTFSSYVDLLIMRSPVQGFAEKMAWLLSGTERPVPIINAGSGKDQHPTQALLDIYTLQRSFERVGGIEGKTVLFVGDLLRGRTVRSLSNLLVHYPKVKQCFVAPPSLQIGPDVLAHLDAAGVEYELSSDFERQIPAADAIYMTRIQDEWDNPAERGKLDISAFSFTEKQLALLKPAGVILHPLPRRTEIAVAVDRDPRAVYWRQVRNGMWIRVALMLMIFGRDQEVLDYFADNMG